MASFEPYNYAQSVGAGQQNALREIQAMAFGQKMREQNAIREMMRSENPQQALRQGGYLEQANQLATQEADFMLKGLDFIRQNAKVISTPEQYTDFKSQSERLGFSRPGILPDVYDDNTKAMLKRIAAGADRQYKTIQGPGGSILQEELGTGKLSQVVGREPKGTTVNVNGDKTTPGFKKVDEKFADEYVDWKARGGFADVAKNLKQLSMAHNKLATGQVETGPVNIFNPDMIQGITSPELKNVRQQVQEVVQRNLRIILGAQFTQKEGEQLISRAFDDTLETSVNAQRVNRLMTQIRDAAKAKQEAVEYFDEHGTLRGFKGKTYSKADFDADTLFKDASQLQRNPSGHYIIKERSEFDMLQSGDLYISPINGKLYRKQ